MDAAPCPRSYWNASSNTTLFLFTFFEKPIDNFEYKAYIIGCKAKKLDKV